MKKSAVIIATAIAIIIGMWWLKSSHDAAYIRFIESLYQQAQAGHRAEEAKRQANIEKLAAIEAQTAAAYLDKIDKLAADADKRIAAISWRSNAELRKAKASADEVLVEKAKVETALGEMTLSRDCLLISAHTREKEILAERGKLKVEFAALLQAKQDELDLCEKARQDALSRTVRKTWLSIGPGYAIYMQNGQVRTAPAITIHIPIVDIKSPFKRF